jgi:hypothetical protein
MRLVSDTLFKLAKPAFFGLFAYLSIFLFSALAYADISANDNWNIEIKDINLTSDSPLGNQKKQATTEQPKPGTYSGTNYAVQSGFEGLDPFTPFSINVTNNFIEYGPLSPTNPIYRTLNINIVNDNIKSFIVTTYEDHTLSTTGLNLSIPDSTCDNGSCSQVTSALWTNTLTYGFGYRCDNINSNSCPIDFKISDYYKQFSDISKKETPQILLSDNNPGSNPEIQITYKVNISKTQSPDSYSNTITYIASPGY